MSQFQFTRPNNFPPIIKNLIIINALVFLAQVALQSQFELTEKISLYPIISEQFRQLLVEASVYKPNEGFEPYQIATHMFAHGSLPHIFFNMYALWLFGKEVENRWGPKRFLLFYLVCGVGAAFLHLGIEHITGGHVPMLGASGAVMGVSVAFAYLFPNTELILFPIPVPIKAKWMVIGYVALDLFSGVSGRADGIAHFAHVGGAITGFILVLIWQKTDRKRFY